jgi:Fe2+ or Zn2+ uptake regulation protein
MMAKEITFSLNESLHKTGRRMTPQRRTVLTILENTKTHLDAEGIWKQARKLGEELNLATVYRTLSVLKEMGLVDQRYFARDHKREVYEPSHKPEHYHFTCISCGNVTEFTTSRISELRSELETEISVQLTHSCLCLEGLCSDCHNKSSIDLEKQ